MAHFSTIVEHLEGYRLGILRAVFGQLIAAPPHTSAPVVSLAATHSAGPSTRVGTSPVASLNRGSTFVPAKIRDDEKKQSGETDPTLLLMSAIKNWSPGDDIPFSFLNDILH